MATYTHSETTIWESALIYGSSRLGMYKSNLDLSTAPNPQPTSGPEEVWHGTRQYEISNHLGNVLTVISDRRIAANGTTTGSATYYTADIVSVTDYYPFGSMIENRSWSTGGGYRFGFNGQEKDDEVAGTGNSYTAEYWQYDSRLGRRWNVDPVDKPWMSSYHAFSNDPIAKVDPNGANDDWVEKTNEGGSKSIVWDENVTSSDDQDLKTGDRYLGRQGADAQNYYHSNGTTSHLVSTLKEATIAGVKSEHAKLMNDPMVQRIHSGQNAFLDAAWNNLGTQGLLWIVPGTQLAKGIGVGLVNVSTQLGTRIATRTILNEGVTLASTFKGNIRLGFSMGEKVNRYIPLDDVAIYGINSSKAFAFRGNTMFTTKLVSTSAKDIYWNLALNYSTNGGRSINYFGTGYSRFQARQFGFYLKGNIGPQHGGLGGGAVQYVGLKGGIKYFGL